MGEAIITHHTTAISMEEIESEVNGYALYGLSVPAITAYSGYATESGSNRSVSVERTIETFNKKITAVNIKNYTAAQNKFPGENGNGNPWNPSSLSNYRSTVVMSTSKSQYKSTNSINLILQQNYQVLLDSRIIRVGFGSDPEYGDANVMAGINTTLVVRGMSLIISSRYLYYGTTSWILPMSISITSPALTTFYIGIEFA